MPVDAGDGETAEPSAVDSDVLELKLQERLDALPKAGGAELLRVLMLPDLEGVERIGEFWSYPQSRALAAPDRLRGGSDASGVEVEDSERWRQDHYATMLLGVMLTPIVRIR